MNATARLFSLALFVALLTGCRYTTPTSVPQELVVWPEMTYPQDNAPDAQKQTLGEQLFNDPILSIDSSISCASCHKLAYGLADHLPVSPGVEGRLGKRNSPSLWNVGYQPYFMREGGVPTLEMQALVPIQEHVEMDFNLVLLAERLNQNTDYRNAFLDAFADSATAYTITRALGQYQRTLISNQAPIDSYIAGDETALSAEAQEGLDLFFGKAQCNTCHTGPLFTDYGFHNNGTPPNENDYGRAELTLDTADFFTFKTPSLRHVSETAPYMHDGSLPSLSAVLQRYNEGGTEHPYQSEHIEPLNLTAAELVALERFLEAL
ncbi:MAG: Cytochrome c551 peroxidase [Cryomorphaceae bacterium]|nr:MAG: Cytochrome c551 peroxidase [Cryomorphaceae bacterium]